MDGYVDKPLVAGPASSIEMLVASIAISTIFYVN